MTVEVRRALSGLASGLALAVRPAGAAEVSGVKGGRYAHRLGDATGGSAPDAGGAGPGQCAAFRSGGCDLSLGDRHTWRDGDRRASSRRAVVHGALRRVRAAAGRGASTRRAAARAGALSRWRQRARLPRHLRRESPTSLAAMMQRCPVRSRSPCSSRASFASLGLGRSAWRAEGAPLKT
jgi:hypothetical protein